MYDLPQDDSDVYGRPKTLMVVEKMAVRRLSGTLSLTSMKHQGSAIHSGIELFDFSGENGYSIHANKKTAKRRQQEIAAMNRQAAAIEAAAEAAHAAARSRQFQEPAPPPAAIINRPMRCNFQTGWCD